MEMESSVVPYLPPEVIADVLVRLPVRVLCKLCCVSKQWYALITNPIFRDSYRSRSEQNPRILLKYYPDPVDHHRVVFSSLDYKYGKVESVSGFEIMKNSVAVSICLDLVCLYGERNMYIWNPCTGDHIQVPEYPLPVPKIRPHSPFQQEVVAFGLDNSSAKYKLLHIRFLNQHHSHCALFTLGGSQVWKETKPPPDGRYHNLGGACAFHGAIYLVRKDRVIPRFDLETEEWTSIDGPKLEDEYAPLGLNQLGGSLCLIEFCMRFDTSTTVWSLDNRGIWVWKYNIDLSSSVFGLHTRVAPLLIEKDGRLLLRIGGTGGLCYYEPKTKNLQDIYFYSGRGACSAFLYIESLNSLKF